MKRHTFKGRIKYALILQKKVPLYGNVNQSNDMTFILLARIF